jgi:hypothetical protein
MEAVMKDSAIVMWLADLMRRGNERKPWHLEDLPRLETHDDRILRGPRRR